MIAYKKKLREYNKTIKMPLFITRSMVLSMVFPDKKIKVNIE